MISDQLPISEQFRIEAAKGWVLLGDLRDAHEELNHISKQWKQHPEVLELRWYLFAEEPDWESALPIAQKIHKKHPERLFGWLALAHSIFKSTLDAEAAFQLLSPAAEIFEGPQVAYGLACYASLTGDFTAARDWLSRAIEKSDDDQLEDFYKAHPELEALNDYLQKL